MVVAKVRRESRRSLRVCSALSLGRLGVAGVVGDRVSDIIPHGV